MRERFLLWTLALLCLLPAVVAFFGEGSFQSVYGSLADESAAAGARRRELLLAALRNSGWIGLIATGIALVLGVPVAWLLAARPNKPSNWFVYALCAMPLALAPSIAVSGWLQWFAPSGIRSAFGLPQVIAEQPGPLFSVAGVGLVLGLSLWPVVCFEAMPAFRRVRGSVL